jgi:hypothetical protein
VTGKAGPQRSVARSVVGRERAVSNRGMSEENLRSREEEVAVVEVEGAYRDIGGE